MFEGLRLLLRLSIAIGALAIAGCATLTKGTEQAVSLDTPGVVGATCTLTSSAIASQTVQTPATVKLEKSQQNVSVVCRKECYNDAVSIIPSHTEEMAAGNILVGGVVGLGIDAASGAMNKYDDINKVSMTPIPGCRPASG